MEEYHQITLSEYLSAKQHVKEGLNRAAQDFVYIGYWLKRIRDSEGYRQEGYSSISEFGKKEFHLSESAVSRFMDINDRFSFEGNSPMLDEKYKDYGSSKLTEMLQLPDMDLQLIKPDTRRDDIRELKQLNKEQEPAEGRKQDMTLDMLVTLKEVFEDKEEEFNKICKGCSAEAFSEYVNPNGNMTKRRGLAMLFFYPYEEGFKYKGLNMQPVSFTYEYLMELFLENYGDVIRSDNPWQEAYGIQDGIDCEEQGKEEEKQDEVPMKEQETSVEAETFKPGKRMEAPIDIGEDTKERVEGGQQELYMNPPEPDNDEEAQEEETPTVSEDEDKACKEQADYHVQVQECLERMQTFLAAGAYEQLAHTCPILQENIRKLVGHV